MTTVEGPRVRHQQAQAHIGVPSNTSIHSARAQPDQVQALWEGPLFDVLGRRARRPPWVANSDSPPCIWRLKALSPPLGGGKAAAAAHEQQQSGRPTACKWEAEDVRPVQAEAELKHAIKETRRRCRRQRGTSRTRSSSACPHCAALCEFFLMQLR